MLKKLLFILVVLFFTPLIANAKAQEAWIEIGDNGEVRIVEESQVIWRKSDVTVTPKARKYPGAVIEAFQNPGEMIPVEMSTIRTTSIFDPFITIITKIVDVGVIYDPKAKTVVRINDVGAQTESEALFPFLIFALTAVVLMGISNLREREYFVFASVAAAFAIFAFISAFFATTTTFATLAFVVAAIVTFFIAGVAAEGRDREVYRFLSGNIYVCVIGGTVLMYV